MPDSKYVPRGYSLDPLDFGQPSRNVRWRAGYSSARDTDRLRASQAQHAYVKKIRTALRSAYPSVKAFAETNGLNYERLARMLRGEIVMTLEDIAMAERLLPGMFGLSGAKS